ncbi:MAG: hypothetical protein ACK42E_01930 [Candidatus Bipolaricaulaceae bacterium]
MRRNYFFLSVLVLLTFGLAASAANPIVKKYAWHDKGGTPRTYEFTIPWELYWECKTRPRVSDYVAYVVDLNNAYLMLSLAHLLLSKAPYDHKGRIEFVAAFVQGAIPYVADQHGEHPKYPVETLVEGGDCEDKAILLAAFLRVMGYRVALLVFPDHVAVGVACPTCWGTYYLQGRLGYFYIEATSPGWSVGEVPPEFRGKPALVFVVR